MTTILTESALTVRVIVTIAYLVHHGVTESKWVCYSCSHSVRRFGINFSVRCFGRHYCKKKVHPGEIITTPPDTIDVRKLSGET